MTHNIQVHKMADPVKNISPKDEVFLLIGHAGAGRSTLIDSLVEKEGFRANESLAATNTNVEATMVIHPKHPHHRIILVEFPGFNGIEKPDTEILCIIRTWLADVEARQVKLSGILYLHSITEVRATRPSQRNLSILGRSVGQEAMKRFVFVTTMWGNVPKEEGEAMEQQRLLFWNELIVQGARVHRLIDRSAEGAWEILDALIQESAAEGEPTGQGGVKARKRVKVWFRVRIMNLSRRMKGMFANRRVR